MHALAAARNQDSINASFEQLCQAAKDESNAALARYIDTLASLADWAGEQDCPGFGDIVLIQWEKLQQLASRDAPPGPDALACMETWQGRLNAYLADPGAETARSWVSLLGSPGLPDPLASDDIDVLCQMLVTDGMEEMEPESTRASFGHSLQQAETAVLEAAGLLATLDAFSAVADSEGRGYLQRYHAALSGVEQAAASSGTVFGDILLLIQEAIVDIPQEPETQLLELLRAWPRLLLTYLRSPNPETASALAQSLASPALPNPLSEEDMAGVRELLLAELELVPPQEMSILASSPEEEVAAVDAAPIEIAGDILLLLREEWKGIGSAFVAMAERLAHPGLSAQEHEAILARLGDVLEPFTRACAGVGLDITAKLVRKLFAMLEADPVNGASLAGAWPRLLGAWLEHFPAESEAMLRMLSDHRWHNRLSEREANELRAHFGRFRLAQSEAATPRHAAFAPADLSLETPPDVNPELLDTLLSELPRQTEEFLQAIQRIGETGTLDDIKTARRIAHTLKGSGNLVGIRGIASLTHALEDVLQALYQEQTPPNKPLLILLLEAADCLEGMSDTLLRKAPPPEEAWRVLQSVLAWSDRIAGQGLQAVLAGSGEQGEEAKAPAQPITAVPSAEPREAAEQAVRVSTELIHDLFRQAGESLTVSRQVSDRLKQIASLSRERRRLGKQLEELLAEQENLVDVRGVRLPSMLAREPRPGEFDPLEMEQYHELHTLTHRLREVATDSWDLGEALSTHFLEMGGLLARQDRLHRDLQETLLHTRMLPVKTIFTRCQRCVRQTGRLTDKEVELILEGGDTLIDGEILDRLIDPLMHLLRNAVDHGLELPGLRQELGKGVKGCIRLSFERMGNRIIVRCADDGAGMDQERIRRTALEKGFIREDQILGEQDLMALVLLPGFSTRETASQTSGRGVGLDVVHDRILELKGEMEIRSQPGLGCELEIRLPASLISTYALLLQAGQQRYAIAHAGIEQILYPGAGTLKRVGEEYVYRTEHETHPAIYLESLLGFPVGQRFEEAPLPVMLVRERHGVTRAVILPNGVIGMSEVAVKNLGDYIPALRGIIGAAILGDGGVVPVLDLPDLLRAERRQAPLFLAETDRQAEKPHLPRALVVDDSLSARRSLAQFLADSGHEVRTAIDGMEAIEILSAFRPDVLLTDLEMPRMNGMELTSHLRASTEYRHLPIVMITSRSTEKHRLEAEKTGVSAYINKPYSEEDLILQIRTLLDKR